jgi:hypothetical protein
MRTIVAKRKQEDFRSIYDPEMKMKMLELLKNNVPSSDIIKRFRERKHDTRLPTKQELDRWGKDLDVEISKTKDYLVARNQKEKKRDLPEKVSIAVLAFSLGVPQAPLWERALKDKWPYDANGSPRNKSMWFFIVNKLPADILMALRQSYK